MKSLFKSCMAILATVALTLGLGTSLPAQADEPITIEVGAPKAPPVLPILRMIQTNALGNNVKIHINWWPDPQTLIAMVQNQSAQVYAFPLTVVARLYNKGLPVQLLNANTWGVEAFMTTDPAIHTWADLKGKTIYVPLKSSPPDILTQYFLKQAGVDPHKDVNIVYVNKAELAQLMIAGRAQYATLIEPLATLVTMKNPKVHVAFRFEPFWQAQFGKNALLPTAGIGALSGWLKAHPELAEKFNAAYAQALQWVVSHPAEAGKMAQAQLGMPAAVVEHAIPHMGMLFKSAKEAEPILTPYFQVLYNFNPVSVGGKVPDAGMYFGH